MPAIGSLFVPCERAALAALVVGLWATSSAAQDAVLAEAAGVDLVRAHCTGCHSPRLIVQNRGDARHWRQLIRWMQETQGLWPIPEPQLDRIVEYLAKNYPPQRALRRRPLPPWQRPPTGRSGDGGAG